MLELEISDKSIKRTMRWMDDVGKKQIPFALAVALTKTAKDVQKDELKHLHREFTIRNKWPERGPLAVKITPATKKRMFATVFTKADFMPLHETGGTKIPEGNHLAIPTSNVKRGKTGKITKGQRPRNLKKSFVLETKGGQLGIWQRKGRGKRSEIKPMYWLEPRANIKKSWDWFRTGFKTINRTFNDNFSKSLDKALRTSRK